MADLLGQPAAAGQRDTGEPRAAESAEKGEPRPECNRERMIKMARGRTALKQAEAGSPITGRHPGRASRQGPVHGCTDTRCGRRKVPGYR